MFYCKIFQIENKFNLTRSVWLRFPNFSRNTLLFSSSMFSRFHTAQFHLKAAPTTVAPTLVHSRVIHFYRPAYCLLTCDQSAITCPHPCRTTPFWFPLHHCHDVWHCCSRRRLLRFLQSAQNSLWHEWNEELEVKRSTGKTCVGAPKAWQSHFSIPMSELLTLLELN